jgi:glutamate dehydrogenase/leucine dehydrogenase
MLGDPDKDKTEALFRSFGPYVETMGGRYITAEDIGTSTEDMQNIHAEAWHVVGMGVIHGARLLPRPFSNEEGGSGRGHLLGRLRGATRSFPRLCPSGSVSSEQPLQRQRY